MALHLERGRISIIHGRLSIIWIKKIPVITARSRYGFVLNVELNRALINSTISQGTYPVIFLSFAAIKSPSFDEARKSLFYLIEKLYNRYEFLLKDDCFVNIKILIFN